MTPPLVLVVDDEQPLVDLVASYLRREGYQVLCAYDGLTALELAERELPDVIVLDLMLPELDGLEVCRQIRALADPYVIMLTARVEETDKLIGLAVGADDYLTKPFSPRELVARVKAMLRRPHSSRPMSMQASSASRQFQDLTIDINAHEVRSGETELVLTPLEFELVRLLSDHPRRVFTRGQLLEQLWGDDFYGDEHVVDVHISNLRRKLEPNPAVPRYIETVRGVGYRWGPSS